MGDLIKASNSELQSTIELFDHLGVTPEDFATFRRASSWSQQTIARIHKTDRFMWAALEFVDKMERMGGTEADFRLLMLDKKITEVLNLARTKVSSIIPIDRANPFNPATFIGQGWTFWQGPPAGNGLKGKPEQDDRSIALTEVDASKILLETHLQLGETSISGEERIKRLVTAKRIRMDLTMFQTFWNNQNIIPESFGETIDGNTIYVFFDGQTLRSPSGIRYSLCLCRDGAWWHWGVFRLCRGRGRQGPSAVLAR